MWVEVERRGERRLLSDCYTVIQTVCEEGVKLFGVVPETRWGVLWPSCSSEGITQ